MATAATNGAIILWDINKVGRKTGKQRLLKRDHRLTMARALERVINEHARAVNRICFQPDNGNILLSASQDGTMKCWVRRGRECNVGTQGHSHDRTFVMLAVVPNSGSRVNPNLSGMSNSTQLSTMNSQRPSKQVQSR